MVLTRAARRARRSAEQLTLDTLGEDALGLVVQGLASPSCRHLHDRSAPPHVLISCQDYASVAATCTVLRRVCSHGPVLARLALPVRRVPRALLHRLSIVANPRAHFRLGLLSIYKEHNQPEGMRLLRMAAAAGMAEASWELYLLLRPAHKHEPPGEVVPGERDAMLQAALAAGHKAAIVQKAPNSERLKRLRESFDPPMQGLISVQAAQADSIETQAAARAAGEWLEEDDTFVRLEDEQLAAACWARCIPRQTQPGCHRFMDRSGERRDQRRRQVLGLPEAAELPRGPPKLMKCDRCRRAFYCSSICQVLHWPDHKHVCAPL